VTVSDTSGRTIWQAQDVAYYERERVVLLGTRFGPAGITVANWLECKAKAQNDDGMVKAGYAAIARGAFIPGADEELVQQIVAFMVEIKFLKQFNAGEYTFVAEVAAFKEDQPRGHRALKRAFERAAELAEELASLRAELADAGADDPGVVALGATESLSGPHVAHREDEEKRFDHQQQPAGADENVPDGLAADLRPVLQKVVEVLRRVETARPSSRPVTVADVGLVMVQFPGRPHIAAAEDFERWLLHGSGSGNRVTDIVGLYRNQLLKRWDDVHVQGAARGGQPRGRTGRPTGDPGHDQERYRRSLAVRALQGDEAAEREYESLTGTPVGAAA
jgi:hypothetical protein